ncbi:protein containing Peptidase S8 and S53, subtilisin, kexin, sedolisin domain, partial [methanotrophic bacterial endosymbiont of Bathymodiolus sp.]
TESNYSGTSFSAPYIAGIFAVACSAYPQICDTWETSLIYKALRDTGTLGTVTDVNGKPLVGSTSRFITQQW